jgi:hypothetical protein
MVNPTAFLSGLQAFPDNALEIGTLFEIGVDRLV